MTVRKIPVSRLTSKKRIENIKDLCNYLEGGGIDTSDIVWLMDQYEHLKKIKKVEEAN